jgi:hypothetical protein
MCVTLPFGVNVDCATENKSTARFDAASKAVSTSITRSSTTNTTTLSASQSLALDFEGAEIDCDLSVTQRQSVDARVVTEISSQVAAAVLSDLKQEMESQIKQSSEATQNWMATAVDVSNTSELVSTMNSVLEQYVSVESLTAVIVQLNIQQTLTLNFRNAKLRGDLCDFTQDQAVHLFAQTFMTNLVSSMSSNSTIQKLIAEADQHSESETSGPLEGLAAVFSSITGVFIIIGILVIVFVALWLKFGAKIIGTTVGAIGNGGKAAAGAIGIGGNTAPTVTGGLVEVQDPSNSKLFTVTGGERLRKAKRASELIY